MSTLNSTQINAIPFNGNASAFVPTVPLSIDARTLAPTWHDERSITLSETTMTAFNEELKDIVIGDDRRISRVYATLPTGYTISKAWLTIKKRQTDADVDALIQKTITASLTDAGQITDASTASGSIALYFDLDTTDTDGMPTRKPCHYDIQIKTSDGDIHTLEMGTVTFVQGITVSIS